MAMMHVLRSAFVYGCGPEGGWPRNYNMAALGARRHRFSAFYVLAGFFQL